MRKSRVLRAAGFKAFTFSFIVESVLQKRKKKVAVIQANKWMHVFNCLPVMMGVCLQNELSWVGTTGGKALARF